VRKFKKQTGEEQKVINKRNNCLKGKAQDED